MREQRFFRSPQSAATQPPPPSQTQTRIEISWGEAVAKTIGIRRQHIEMATKVCGINLNLENAVQPQMHADGHRYQALAGNHRLT
jgi:hypothetical protein